MWLQIIKKSILRKKQFCVFIIVYVWRLYEELHLQAATLACPLPKLLIYFNFESATPLLGKWRHLLNLVATRVEEAMENFVFPDENRTKWINLWPFFTCPRITPNHSNLSFSLLEISENSQFLFHCCQCQCMKPWNPAWIDAQTSVKVLFVRFDAVVS